MEISTVPLKEIRMETLMEPVKVDLRADLMEMKMADLKEQLMADLKDYWTVHEKVHSMDSPMVLRMAFQREDTMGFQTVLLKDYLMDDQKVSLMVDLMVFQMVDLMVTLTVPLMESVKVFPKVDLRYRGRYHRWLIGGLQ